MVRIRSRHPVTNSSWTKSITARVPSQSPGCVAWEIDAPYSACFRRNVISAAVNLHRFIELSVPCNLWHKLKNQASIGPVLRKPTSVQMVHSFRQIQQVTCVNPNRRCSDARSSPQSSASALAIVARTVSILKTLEVATNLAHQASTVSWRTDTNSLKLISKSSFTERSESSFRLIELLTTEYPIPFRSHIFLK